MPERDMRYTELARVAPRCSVQRSLQAGQTIPSGQLHSNTTSREFCSGLYSRSNSTPDKPLLELTSLRAIVQRHASHHISRRSLGRRVA